MAKTKCIGYLTMKRKTKSYGSDLFIEISVLDLVIIGDKEAVKVSGEEETKFETSLVVVETSS